MPENVLYVEGSTLNRFVAGEIYLEPVFSNRILLACNKPVPNELVNAASAARCTLGVHVDIVGLDTPLVMEATIVNGSASGNVFGWQELVDQVKGYFFDALAIATKIDVPLDTAKEYVKSGRGVNPWGGVEAVASKLIGQALNKPVAHSPYGHTLGDDFNDIVDARMAAEFVSETYIHCVFKGLSRAPRINLERGISIEDVSCLITPHGCFGDIHEECHCEEIPMYAIIENKTVLTIEDHGGTTYVNNYLEMAGILSCMKAGIEPEYVRRPIPETRIV